MIFQDVAVVGMHFREREGVSAKAIVAGFMPPVVLQLVREPENQYDSFAIKVYYKEQHIGYIEASKAMYIAPHMDDGIELLCVVDSLEQRKNNLHPICTISDGS